MSGVMLGHWLGESPREEHVPTFAVDQGEVKEALAGCHVVTPRGGRGRIDELLAAGACKVLIGEAALLDSGLVNEMVEKHGAERIGIWLPVRRTSANWNLDSESNADFTFVSISTPLPRWMVLRADGSLTDVDALWWAGEMMKAGSSLVMVSVSEPHDDDLLSCAEMSEIAAEKFWLDTGTTDVEELRFWVKYGHAQQLVIPAESELEVVLSGLNERLIQESAVG
jgi:hypothetical protein